MRGKAKEQVKRPRGRPRKNPLPEAKTAEDAGLFKKEAILGKKTNTIKSTDSALSKKNWASSPLTAGNVCDILEAACKIKNLKRIRFENLELECHNLESFEKDQKTNQQMIADGHPDQKPQKDESELPFDLVETRKMFQEMEEENLRIHDPAAYEEYISNQAVYGDQSLASEGVVDAEVKGRGT